MPKKTYLTIDNKVTTDAKKAMDSWTNPAKKVSKLLPQLRLHGFNPGFLFYHMDGDRICGSVEMPTDVVLDLAKIYDQTRKKT